MVKQKINVAALFEGAPEKNPKSVAAGKAGVAVRLATLKRRRAEAIGRLEGVPIPPRAAKRASTRPRGTGSGMCGLRSEPNNGAMSIEAGILIAMQPGVKYTWPQVWKMVDWIPDPGHVRGALSSARKRGRLDWVKVRAGRMCAKSLHAYFLTPKGMKFRAIRAKEVADRVATIGEKEFMRRLYAGRVAALLA